MTDHAGVLDAIERSRRNGSRLDRDEVLARFRMLEGATFDDVGVLAAFSDVFDAVCAPEHITFEPDRSRCRLDAARYEIRFGGLLRSAAGDKIGQIERALDFQLGIARHHQIVINPIFRDVGIAALILMHSMDFYVRVGIDTILLTAALTAGPYYWAKLGFNFHGQDAETTRHWIARVSAKLGLGLDCTQQRSAQEWVGVGRDEGRTLALEAIARAFENEKRELLEARARDCGIAMNEPIPLGKALLLSVSSWEGRLVVDKPARTRVKVYVSAKADGAAKRLQSAIDSPTSDH